ncbi:hypothetical protein BVY03_05145 [bacterium K02(2017)]|nr:hypothetical protein BVY03_05145 [bacterium K02(2017)]
MSKFFFFLGAMTLILGWSQISQAQPILIENIKHYEITGLDHYDLRSQMQLLGPKTTLGETLNTSSKWHIKYDYDFYETDKRCRLQNIKTKLYLTHKIPKWSNIKEAPNSMQKQWDFF